MKKLTTQLLMVLAFVALCPLLASSQTQPLVQKIAGERVATSLNNLTPASRAETLIYGANLDETGSTSGIVSTNLGGIDPGLVETADDFVLGAGSWKITRIVASGFSNTSQGVAAPEQFGVRIYANNDGQPGDLIHAEIIADAYTNADYQNLVLAEELILEGGTYWLAVYGDYPGATAISAARWNWFTWGEDDGPVGYPNMLRDHPNLFGAGATSWTPLSALGADDPSCDFGIYGEEVLTYTVTFTVTDGTDPIEGATIAIADQELTTDVDGIATIELPDGEYEYTVSMLGYSSVTETAEVDGADLDIEVELELLPTYTVSFTVTDGTDPIEGATIAIADQELTTDVDGIATIELPDGEYEYTVSMLGYSSVTETAEVDGADLDIEVELELLPTYTVTFIILNTSDEEIDDAIVTFDGVEANAGDYIFENVPVGIYDYEVAREEFQVYAGTVELVNSDTTIYVVLLGTDIESNTFEHFSAYPNPFGSSITLSNPAVVDRVIFSNIVGQVVLDIPTRGASIIETGLLPAGIYMVTFETANGERTVRKMIKK